MHHNLTLITTLAVSFGLALILGFVAVRMKLPALVGYLVAGVLIGPFTPGFVANAEIAYQLAEIGVMLLMFGVGLHFSLNDLLAVKRVAVPGAIVQMAAATLMGSAVARYWGWNFGGALVFGISLSVASTVVLLRALEARGILDSVNGRIAIGWLVVEDLAIVLVLVLLPPLGGWLSGSADVNPAELWQLLGQTLLQVVGFVVLMLVVGRRLFPWALLQVQRTGSRELFTLCVVAAAVSVAVGATALFGVSFALGAFFAGMVMRESEFSHRAAEESLPLRDAFAVLFFVSVGMLFDPRVLIDRPLQVLLVTAVIMLGKTLVAAILVAALRHTLKTALTVAASLAQIGEFSFILVGLGMSMQLFPPEGQSLVLAGALLSIAFNPLMFKAVDPLYDWLIKHSSWVRRLEARPDELAELPGSTPLAQLSNHVVLIGYGRVGRRVAQALTAQNISLVVVDESRDQIETLREIAQTHQPVLQTRLLQCVVGDANKSEVLVQAHIATARLLLLATSNLLDVRHISHMARTLNPGIRIVARLTHAEEAIALADEAGTDVLLDEVEIANSLNRQVMAVLRPAQPSDHVSLQI